MIKRINKILLLLLIISMLFLYIFDFLSCNNTQSEKVLKEKRFLFDSFFEISVISKNQDIVKNDLNLIFTEIERLGNDLDWRNEKSYLSSIDNNGNLAISDQFEYLFTKVKYYYDFTDGYFNPFLRKLVLAYNNFKSGTIPPDQKEIDNILYSIKKSKINLGKINGEKGKVILAGNLDLGAAIAGFLVDYCYNFLLSKGYNDFLINGSGEIRVHGNKFGKKWIIGIQSPFSSEIIDAIFLPEGYSISTSGSYERYFIYDNKKYHHILNPFTGKPDSDLISVSVVSQNSCLEADILSTAIFSMGFKKAIKFCNEKNIEYYLIYKENNETLIKKSNFFITSNLKHGK